MEIPEFGEVIVQSILQGSNYSKLVNISDLVRTTSTVGLESGGVIISNNRFGNKCEFWYWIYC